MDVHALDHDHGHEHEHVPLYVDVDEDRQFDDEGLGYSAFYGRQLSDRVWWETEGGFYKVDPNQADFQDFYQYHLTTGLAYAFGDRTGFTPYVIAAVGAIDQEVLPDEDQDTNLTVNAGIGAVTGPIFDNGLKLRGDARYVYDDFDGSGPARGDGAFGDVRLSLGVEIPLGYTKVVTKEKTVIKTREVAAKPQPTPDTAPAILEQSPSKLRRRAAFGRVREPKPAAAPLGGLAAETAAVAADGAQRRSRQLERRASFARRASL